MYQSFNCLQFAVIWKADFTAEEYGYEGDGIVHECECTSCGASITYYCPNDNDRKEGNTDEEGTLQLKE